MTESIEPASPAPPRSFPPTRYGILDEVKAANDLEAIDVWKRAWIASLGGNGAGVAVAPALLGVLREAFGASPPDAIRALPYRLTPFPKPSGAPLDDLREALLWRAGLVDFLGDCWDTLGPSRFDMTECLAVSARLMPAAAVQDSANKTCAYCLVTYGRERPHFDECGVQQVWRQ
jgi:hypothetical protein